MNRLGTALLAAVEAIVTVGVGLGIALVPLTLLWGFEYGLQVDWDVFWKAAGSVWLVGHGVDVTFRLGADAAGAAGVEGAAGDVHVTLAALGFAVVTAWLGGRAGRRFAETDHRTTGLLVGTVGVALLGTGVALSASSAAIHPVVWQSVVLPALWFAVPALVTSEVCRRRRALPADPLTQRVLDLTDRIPGVWRTTAAFALRAGTIVTAVVVAAAGVVVALLLLTSFADVIALYERSHAGVVGGIAMTVGQLAFLPDLVAWATAWLVGPGFAIGSGSSVSPVGTVLGPIPGIPVFGALPASGHTFGLLWVLVPVVAGFVVGGLLRPRLVQALGDRDSAVQRALAGVATGVVAGVLTGVLTGIASGSVGPGRLAQAGPDGLLVGLFAALEVGVPAVVALAIGSDLLRTPEGGWGRERWHEASDGADADAAAEDARAGSLVAALDEAGAGRAGEPHRFVVREAHDSSTHVDHPDAPVDDPGAVDPVLAGQVTEPITDEPVTAPPVAAEPVPHEPVPHEPVPHEPVAARPASPSASAPAPPSSSTPVAEPDDVPLPDWARTDVVAAERVAPVAAPIDRASHSPRGAVSNLRDRLRGAADGVRSRAADLRGLRDRVPGAGAPDRAALPEQDAEPLPHAPGTEPQPAFPWSTEEFVGGRDDTGVDVPDEQRGQDGQDETGGRRDHGDPARPAPTGGRSNWDATDQIAEDELPWWRRPKHDA
ncbi:DUF6350 family protein [Curtobacterium sp. MCBA15_012]|uniref:cell division protein PerM n=1 Tax=Curtobacterium sp. MCBA15_012 TaxID=1898738 RepID=UPI00273283A2|nr:DUF6350 family protein [Curtobacterium sp. MCBA15_012]WIA99843.1 DUF6350 family protein [Curtobacterium sp. MCBA15_012]